MSYQLAQINIARLLAPIDAPETAEFVANLDRINALAEGSPGFVWRLIGDGDDATNLQAFDDPAIITNMSVWENLDHLAAFVYRSAHRDVMRRRKEWFSPTETYMALWWVPAGHRPSPAEGIARLKTIEALGPTADAFTFRNPFPAPDATPAYPVLDECA
ncbi:DUF3291 domain-containing protein [Phenylobacterium sp. LjRoot225]|uniref:DUF3291 domain-containing protein n=1 Tax=Phenylobacterium sp. LjRoot225 TaxID=3342285 RepID=UPI003ECE0F72